MDNTHGGDGTRSISHTIENTGSDVQTSGMEGMGKTMQEEIGQELQGHELRRNEESDDAICHAELHALAHRLTLARRRDGIARADADWVDRPFDDWLAGLQGESRLSRLSIAELGVGMTLSLAMRDAIIISMVADRRPKTAEVVDKRLLIGFASRPHDPRNAACMGQLLARAFEDKTARIDAARCRHGIDMLSGMVHNLPDEYVVQPLAVIAYITWWMGEEGADEVALRALRLDSDCTLAAIVCSALRHGIWPAWLRRDVADDAEG